MGIVCSNTCCRYNAIKPTKHQKQSICVRHKSYFTGIILLIFISLIIVKYHQLNNTAPNNNNNKVNNLVRTIENDESIGHILSCPTCCTPRIDFDEWLKLSPPNTSYQLLQSHYITRHGGRTQCFKYPCWNTPSSPWNCNEQHGITQTIKMTQDAVYGFKIRPINSTQVIPGNCIIGQLTPHGYNQLYHHGHKLIHRYSKYYNLIPSTLDALNIDDVINNKIKLRADTFERVQKSLMAIFSGMYPNRDHNELDINTLSIEIPIYVEDANYEIITIANVAVCPYLAQLRQQRMNSDVYMDFSMDIISELNETAQYVLNNNIASYVDVFDCGVSYLCFDKSVSFNLTQELFDITQEVYTWQFWYQGIYPDYVTATKYHIGPLLKLIYFRFEYMIQQNKGIELNNDVSSLYMYGGHDTGPIAPLLSAFQYDLNNTWIPFAATITLELFIQSDDSSYWILISYNGVSLIIPQCENEMNEYQLCRWDLFEQWMLSVIPNGIDECPNMKLNEYISQNT